MSSIGLKRHNIHKTPDRQYLDVDSPDSRENIKKHRNLLWLHAEMEVLAEDAIDREICKRLRQFAGQIEYDLPQVVLRQVKAGQEVDHSIIPEGLVPFYRHYKFMVQRASK